jgi:uncharacterized protein (DUF433 family)
VNYREIITADPSIMLGKPIIKGTRITIELIIKKLSEGLTIEDLLVSYPQLKKEDVLAALAYTSDVIAKEEFIET